MNRQIRTRKSRGRSYPDLLKNENGSATIWVAGGVPLRPGLGGAGYQGLVM